MMNAVTRIAVPNTQVLLSDAVLEELKQRFYTPMQEELFTPVLHWSELRQYIDSQKWMRMVERCDDKRLDTLVIFGLFRIAKNKQTQVIKMQRKTLRFVDQGQLQWRWVSASFVPQLNMQNCKSHSLVEFKDALNYALDALFQDLVKQGVLMVFVDDKRKKVPDYQTTFDSFDETPRTSYEVDLSQQWGRDNLISRIASQCTILADNAKLASRYWYKHMWDFVNKERLSLLMKIRQCALSEINFREVHQFSYAKIDTEYFKANEKWLPWLTFIPEKHFNQPNLFSYECLLPLLPESTSKNMVRKINQQPRCIQAWLIRHLTQVKIMLPLVESLSDYPSSIVRSLAERTKNEVIQCNDTHYPVADIVQLIGYRWSRYFSSMIGNVKPKKQITQWRRAMTQFNDVLSWALRTRATIHKNQTWYSLFQQHERWIEALNAERLEEEREYQEELDKKLETSWPPASWESFDTKNFVIEEITTGQRLFDEGREMEHCVFSYFPDCEKATYRVFSLVDKKTDERATLGLYQDPVTHQCAYDQLRSLANGDVEPSFERMANQLIKQINDYVAKH